MERIEAELRRELERFGPAGAIGEIVAVWADLVGAPIAANAWPARISRDGTLHVAAADSIWAFELGHQAPAILTRLRERLGERAPLAIRFAPGQVPSPATPEPRAAAARRVEPTSDDRAAAVSLAAPIEDPELRARVERAAALGLASAAADRRF